MNVNAPPFVPTYQYPTYQYYYYTYDPYQYPYQQQQNPYDQYTWWYSAPQTVPFENVPQGLTFEQLQTNEIVNDLYHQEEWTPVWSQTFQMAQQASIDRDIAEYETKESWRKKKNDSICAQRQLQHPIPEKLVMIDVDYLESLVNESFT